MLPSEEAPLLIVIPTSPLPAIVKSSALTCPSVVVPISNLPLASNQAMSV